MALSNGYGVVVGTLVEHGIEPPDSQGRWPHYRIEVGTPSGVYECVINLKSRTEIRIEERDFRDVSRSATAAVLGLSAGFHPLAPTAQSGALDVVRHGALRDAPTPWWRFFGPSRPCTAWWKESGLDVITLMQYYLNGPSRVFVFGEPFETGLGVHNVHMNQGDPAGSQWWAENGVWQDGGVMLEYASPQPRLSIFVTKFETQSLSTGPDGHPA